MNLALELTNIHKSFKGRKIIQGVDLQVNVGDIFGFLGPNGAGKTTIIRIILGLVYPDAGTVSINGFTLSKNFNKAIASVGAVVETPKFYPYLTGYQNLTLIANLYPDVSKKDVVEILELVGLKSRAEDEVGTYSLGMKQRLGIARALINKPRLVFLDEPMNGLDPKGMLEVRNLIKELAETKKITFFITSHLLKEIETLCNKVAVIKQGQILAQGKTSELIATNTETVEIYTNKVSEAFQCLKDVQYIKAITQRENLLLVELEKGYSADLNRLLITSNIKVQYLVPLKQSLEEYFIQLTKGGDPS